MTSDYYKGAKILMVGESIWIYHKNCVFFKSKVSTLTPIDISTLLIWSIYAGIYEIDSSIL